MTDTSRRLAASWPYPRYARFRAVVRDAATAWFAAHECETHPRYSYLLAQRADWPKNIIVPDVARFIRDSVEAQRSGGDSIPLHKYIHHGLSSQALLFNLVGPMLLMQDVAPLQNALIAKGVPISTGHVRAVLEHEDRSVFNEDAGQPTSIDLALIPSSSGPPVFIECKFVEQEFGGCSVFEEGDCDGRNPAADLALCYLQHIGRRYWDVAKKHGLLDGPVGFDRLCAFAPHYQFFREMLFALEHDGFFVLLSDERSPVFHQDGPQGERGLVPVLRDFLPEAVQRRFIQLSIQELLREMSRSRDHPWVAEFRMKYGLCQE